MFLDSPPQNLHDATACDVVHALFHSCKIIILRQPCYSEVILGSIYLVSLLQLLMFPEGLQKYNLSE